MADAAFIAEELLNTPYRNVQLTARILSMVVQSGVSEHEAKSALNAVHSLISALYPVPLALTPTSDQDQDEHRRWMAQNAR